jgi:hypothetical protein
MLKSEQYKVMNRLFAEINDRYKTRYVNPAVYKSMVKNGSFNGVLRGVVIGRVDR